MCPASTPETDRARTSSPRLAFVASTGRTATMCLATTLNALPAVRAYHEGHDPDEGRTPRLPLINLQNRQAWSTVTDAREVVRERRSPSALLAAAGDASLLVDVAFYNSPLLPQLAELYPSAPMLAIVRRCESFVRSATIMNGEDPQPAGWPDPAKELTNRERFIELGRLRPLEGTPEAEQWPDWSGIQRNVWLWYAVNRHLLACVKSLPRASSLRFEDLGYAPAEFWSRCLTVLGLATPENLALCLARSSVRVNARPGYQVGPLETWSADEQELHHQLARPLEEQLYD